MNAPAAPGWYRDPHGTGSRYWDGQRWSDHVLPEGAPLPPATQPLAPPERNPRGMGARVTVTIALVAGLVAISAILGDFLASLLLDDGGSNGSKEATQIWTLIVVAGLVATRVSYRWFDGLTLLLPIYGIVWLFRIAWRVAYLPFRDWTPRPEEAASWRQVAHPTTPGGMLYVVE